MPLCSKRTISTVRLAGTRTAICKHAEMLPQSDQSGPLVMQPDAEGAARLQRKLGDQRVLDLFARVGSNPALVNRLPAHLSGGQRQRVGIAAALASKPELIIADEPVSALDMSVQAQILNLFMDLQQDLGVASLFITHDLGVVEHVSHDIAVMYRGAYLVETVPTEAVMSKPQHDYTRTLLAAVPRPR